MTRGVVIFAAGVLALILVPWALDWQSPMEWGVATVVPDEANPKQSVETYYQVKVLRPVGHGKECEVTWLRSTTDAKGGVWPAMYADAPEYEVGPQTVQLTMTIPSNAAIGPAKIANGIRWVCNPLQRVFQKFELMPPLTVEVLP